MKNSHWATRISAIYLVVSCCWILFSDMILFSGTDVQHTYWFQTVKGLFFVLASSALLFWLIRRDSRLLCESEARFRLLIESAPDAVLVQSGGRIVYMNAAALDLIGATSAKQIIGRDVINIIHPVSRDIVKERIVSVANGKVPVSCQEETYMRLDGSPVVCEVSAVPIQFDNQDSALVFVRDATERKFAQEQETNAQKIELIRQLAGGMSHELNNLVQVINGNTELARASLSPYEQVQKYLDPVLYAGHQAAECISRIMAFSTSHNPSIADLKLTVEPMKEEVLCARPPAKVAATVAATGGGVKEAVFGNSTVVLLAEDDSMVRSLTERLLRNAGYSVVVARDGVEAVTMFEASANRISAVLLDVVMPNMSGFEAYALIHARDPQMPVIFASGFSGYETPADLTLEPGVNFLQKPFERNVLIKVIQSAVEKRQAQAIQRG